MSIALGCIAHLLAIAAVTYGLDQWLGAEVRDVLRPWAALVAATCLVLGLSNVVQLLRGYGQGEGSRRAILARAATGQPPTDGGPMVVTGVARPDAGAPFAAPLSGSACVAYEYRIYKRERIASGRQRRITVIWMGVAVQPFLVDTGGRAIRVLGMPEIVDEASVLSGQPGPVARARDWVHRARFETYSGTGLTSVLASLATVRFAVHPRGYRQDWHREGWEGDPADLRMDEAVVPVGTTISVAGHRSPQHQALVPEPGGLGGSPISIVRGEASGLTSRAGTLPSSAAAVAVFGALLVAAGAALTWAMAAGYLR